MPKKHSFWVAAGLLWAMGAAGQAPPTADHRHGGQPTVVAAPAPTAAGAVAAPTMSPPAGTYTSPLTVTLSSATAGAKIYYTTDGTTPSRLSSPLYTSPIALTASATLQAFAYKRGRRASAVVTAAYTLTAPPSEADGTLFVASLTPQSGAVSSGSGAATLTLTADATTAVLRFSYLGLTGPLTGSHIHGPGGAILFDVDTAPLEADGSRIWRIVPAGTFDVAAIQAALADGACYLNLHTALYPAGEIKGFLRRTSGSQTFTPPPPPPALPAGPPTEKDAARFLLQASYGPRPGETDAVVAQGFASHIDAQFGLPAVSHLAAYDAVARPGEDPQPGLVRNSLFDQAVGGADQLRQRLVLALSEHFVLSDRDNDVRNFPEGMAVYLDLLAAHVDGNFRDLLEAVTLSPTMGVYLDMAGSSRAIPELGRLPNENYAREILQLFTIGLYELHPDGTLRLDSNYQPIPTYDQAVVEGFAKAFTGWTFGGQNQNQPERFFRPQRNHRIPMEPWPAYHDSGQKQLLGATTLPAGQSARRDLEDALDNIFQHPNVGPFFCRFLIQRLVTSNPSPAYVYRCAQAFDDDGAGVRGSLGAVVRTILLDYEARAADLPGRQDYGHLREPIVRFLGLLRTLGARPRNGDWRLVLNNQPSLSLDQIPLRAPTVFNFFEPSFALPGEIAQAGLVSPEFQITTETTAVGGANLTLAVLGGAGSNGPLRADLAPFLPPQAADDEALLDRIDLWIFARGMSDDTRGILREALADPAFPSQRERRVLTLIGVAVLAPEYVVQK